MQFKASFDKIVNTGIKPEHTFWQVHLIRKLNLITLIGLLNMCIGACFFYAIGFNAFIIDCLIVLSIGCGVLVCNKYLNYIWASYYFFIIGFSFFTSMNLKMGARSYMITYYFPVVISLVHLLGRKETMKHLFLLLFICLISVTVIAFGFKYQWLAVYQVEESSTILSVFNIVFSFCTTIAFVIVVVNESIAQEATIKGILREKEILLAEVFHRVKNNMNIVTSLLNLKKNVSDSTEVQTALEECRNRVYSMALVHQKIFENKNIGQLNFKEYLTELVNEIRHSYDNNENTLLEINADNVKLDLSSAIPCGLIINELLTNSFKHAQPKVERMIVKIYLHLSGNEIVLTYNDNGPGFNVSDVSNKNTLGIELIQSLATQIDAVYSFTNKEGLLFEMRFKSQS